MDIDFLYQAFQQSRKVCTDTRKIEAGSIFFALKGPNFNANAFADEALAKGASLAVIDDAQYERLGKTLLVSNVLQALQAIAKHHRSRLNIPVIGITGSNGKTTTKELIRDVLAKKFHVFATIGNLNNHIGVPLSILSIDSSVEIAVIEMGANHVGEISELCAIANPSHGLITNIGKAHIGTFGGFENIIKGKTELYQHLIENRGTVFINSMDAILTSIQWRFDKHVTYPAPGDNLCIGFLHGGTYVKYKNEEGIEIQTQLTGSYNLSNIAAALCIGKFFGVDSTLADQAIATYSPSNMRSQIVQQGTNTIILDAYNANPSSMDAAIQNLYGLKAEKKVAILGDMFELERESELEHRALGKLLNEKKFNQVLLCGGLMHWAKEECPQALHFQTKHSLVHFLKDNPVRNATVLIKASRGIGLESILEIL